jgi:hypothetical protein
MGAAAWHLLCGGTWAKARVVSSAVPSAVPSAIISVFCLLGRYQLADISLISAHIRYSVSVVLQTLALAQAGTRRRHGAGRGRAKYSALQVFVCTK